MKSAQPLFSKALFYKNLQRFWPILAAYIIVVLLFGYGIANSIPQDTVFDSDFFGDLIYRGSEVLVLLIALFSIVAAAAVFSYMHNSRSTAMINALPFDRKTVFFSNYLSGLFMIMIPLLILFLCLLGIGLSYAVLQIVPLLVWLLVFAVLTLLLYSLAVFMGLITGNIIAHLAFYGIANFLLVGVEFLVKGYLANFLYGFSNNSGYVFEIATPILYASNQRYFYDNGQWGVWIAYLLAALLLTWAAYLLYKKRKMENAGDVIAIHRLNPVFKYGVTLCSSLTFGTILIEAFSLEQNFAAAVGFFLLMGMVGYFTAEMLMQKTFRVWQTYKGLVVYGVLLVLVSISVYNDWYGYACRMPDADQVEAVAFSNSGVGYVNVRLLEADRSRVYLDQLINMPDSIALAYGTPLSLERDSVSDSYNYPVMENLVYEDMKSLWTITPGIYCSDAGVETVYDLHRYMVDNMPDIRDTYRQYLQERWNRGDELRNYIISFAYRLDSGDLQYYNFPVLLPLYPEDDSEQQILSHLAAIAGCQEERSKRAAALDIEAENLRYLDINFHLHRYYNKELEKKMAAGDVEIDPPRTIEQEPMEIEPEDRAAFLQAAQADYRDMSDYQMFDAQYLSCAGVDMQVEFPHLPSYNRFRERSYYFNLSPDNQHVFDFLQERGYIDAEIVGLIKEYAGK